jgi:hypothetical protein
MRRKKPIPASVRETVIVRDNGRCRACGIGDRDALQCDHILPESKGGTDRLDNLQALCGVCNNRKGNTDIGELPILPPVEGFGDFSDVMHRRGVFMENLAAARSAEYATLASIAATMRENGVAGYKIRKSMEKMVDRKYVEKILQASR